MVVAEEEETARAKRLQALRGLKSGRRVAKEEPGEDHDISDLETIEVEELPEPVKGGGPGAGAPVRAKTSASPVRAVSPAQRAPTPVEAAAASEAEGAGGAQLFSASDGSERSSRAGRKSADPSVSEVEEVRAFELTEDGSSAATPRRSVDSRHNQKLPEDVETGLPDALGQGPAQLAPSRQGARGRRTPDPNAPKVADAASSLGSDAEDDNTHDNMSSTSKASSTAAKSQGVLEGGQDDGRVKGSLATIHTDDDDGSEDSGSDMEVGTLDLTGVVAGKRAKDTEAAPAGQEHGGPGEEEAGAGEGGRAADAVTEVPDVRAGEGGDAGGKGAEQDRAADVGRGRRSGVPSDGEDKAGGEEARADADAGVGVQEDVVTTEVHVEAAPVPTYLRQELVLAKYDEDKKIFEGRFMHSLDDVKAGMKQTQHELKSYLNATLARKHAPAKGLGGTPLAPEAFAKSLELVQADLLGVGVSGEKVDAGQLQEMLKVRAEVEANVNAMLAKFNADKKQKAALDRDTSPRAADGAALDTAAKATTKSAHAAPAPLASSDGDDAPASLAAPEPAVSHTPAAAAAAAPGEAGMGVTQAATTEADAAARKLREVAEVEERFSPKKGGEKGGGPAAPRERLASNASASSLGRYASECMREHAHNAWCSTLRVLARLEC